MSRDVWGIVSGLFVVAIGVVALTGLLRASEAPVAAAPEAPPPPTSVSTVDLPPASVAPELPGVSSLISRVLEWNGDAGFAGDDDLAQLPPTVVEVLTQYDVPLRIPVTEEGS